MTWLRRLTRRPWLLGTLVIATAVLVAAGITGIVLTVRGETCDDWGQEATDAIEDGSLMDGTWEPSEACVEQMHEDLDRLEREGR